MMSVIHKHPGRFTKFEEWESRFSMRHPVIFFLAAFLAVPCAIAGLVFAGTVALVSPIWLLMSIF